MANTISPNMGLVVPGIGTEYSPTWATDLNASLSSIDSHNHSSGQGVQINPNGLNINADMAFQGNNATLLRSTRYSVQNAVLSNSSDVGCLYVVGNELYYNDVTGGHNVQMTSNGSVNATSSGISSGTASAAFSAGVLVVKSSSTSGANVLMQSVVLTNSGNLTNQLTLSAPSLSGSGTITLPAIPAAQNFMTIDSSGNMAAYAPIANGITRSNLASVGQQVSSSCGSFSTTSESATAVTNLSISITTSGRPVMVMIQPAGISNASFVPQSTEMNVYIYRGGINQATFTFGLTSATVNYPGYLAWLDTPSAGTYTYAIYANSVNGNTISISNCVLMVYEL